MFRSFCPVGLVFLLVSFTTANLVADEAVDDIRRLRETVNELKALRGAVAELKEVVRPTSRARPYPIMNQTWKEASGGFFTDYEAFVDQAAILKRDDREAIIQAIRSVCQLDDGTCPDWSFSDQGQLRWRGRPFALRFYCSLNKEKRGFRCPHQIEGALREKFIAMIALGVQGQSLPDLSAIGDLPIHPVALDKDGNQLPADAPHRAEVQSVMEAILWGSQDGLLDVLPWGAEGFEIPKVGQYSVTFIYKGHDGKFYPVAAIPGDVPNEVSRRWSETVKRVLDREHHLLPEPVRTRLRLPVVVPDKTYLARAQELEKNGYDEEAFKELERLLETEGATPAD